MTSGDFEASKKIPGKQSTSSACYFYMAFNACVVDQLKIKIYLTVKFTEWIIKRDSIDEFLMRTFAVTCANYFQEILQQFDPGKNIHPKAL